VVVGTAVSSVTPSAAPFYLIFYGIRRRKKATSAEKAWARPAAATEKLAQKMSFCTVCLQMSASVGREVIQ
jgi:hypothetical protein